MTSNEEIAYEADEYCEYGNIKTVPARTSSAPWRPAPPVRK